MSAGHHFIDALVADLESRKMPDDLGEWDDVVKKHINKGREARGMKPLAGYQPKPPPKKTKQVKTVRSTLINWCNRIRGVEKR